MKPNDQVLEVWGDFACFTRPDIGKVERFTYPVITPSAARAVFDAIYWKPSFRWQTSRIELLAMPRYIALRRNEVKEKGPTSQAIKRWQSEGQAEPIWADGDSTTLGSDQHGRTQRQTIALKDVRYRLHAHIVPWPGHEGALPAMEAQFKRRAARGQCIYQPYLGCREFAAWFRLADGADAPAVALDMEIGWMLYDVFDQSRPGKDADRPVISMFDAKIERGILDLPAWESATVHKPIRGDLN